MFKRFWKGFRWWEGVLILFFATLLVVITLPRLSRFSCRTTQSEAKWLLQRALAAQLLYFEDYGHYATLPELRQKRLVELEGSNYILTDFVFSDRKITLGASGKPDKRVKDDRWTLNESGELINVANGCQFED